MISATETEQKMATKHILVAGGSGFIGSAFIRHILATTNHTIVNIDRLSYAVVPEATANLDETRYRLEVSNIADFDAVTDLCVKEQPDYIINFAAETHVDRSIEAPGDFINSNIIGTFNLLQATRQLATTKPVRYHHVSTDEVYGSLSLTAPRFTETSPYAPRSPYSASKAASDHLVTAWGETYGVDVVISNCSNNYGPFQFPEKLIPATIYRAINDQSLPVYGTGENVRDWLHVDDHARALLAILTRGRGGETYLVGGDSEQSNIEIVRMICKCLDTELGPDTSFADQITFVADRPGHDFRYAVDHSKLTTELGWTPIETLESGLKDTVRWYLANQDIMDSADGRGSYANRIGLVKEA